MGTDREKGAEGGKGTEVGRYRKHWNWKATRNHEIMTVDPSQDNYTSFINLCNAVVISGSAL